MNPTMKPRVMRTQAGLAATSPMRPQSVYDPAPGGAAPWMQGATQTPAQPGAARFTPLAPQQAQGPQGRVQTANTGRQSVGSSYAAGNGLPQVVGGSVAASAPRPATVLRSPGAQATFGGLMSNAARAAQQATPQATGPARVLQMPQQGSPATQSAPQAAPQGGGAGGTGTNSKGPSRRSNKSGGGVETGSSGSGLAADSNGDGQADNPLLQPQDANGDGQPDQTGVDDTPDGGQTNEDMKTANRRAQARAAGYYVDAEGNVWREGTALEQFASGGRSGKVKVGNINDDESWNQIEQSTSQAQGPGDVDLSNVPEEGRAQAQAIVDSGQFWIDETTGNVYLKDENGAANPDQNSPVGNIYDGTYSGKAKAIADGAAVDDGKATVEEILQQILGMQPEQQSDEALQAKIGADQQSRQYAAAQGIQSAMAAGSRARMGAGWMAGTAGDISAQENLASAQGAADLRLEHERQNLMARIDMMNRQIAAIMAMAGYADNDAARAATEALARQQQAFQMQLNDLERQRSQQIGWKDIFGLGGNLLGGAAGGFVNWALK